MAVVVTAASGFDLGYVWKHQPGHSPPLDVVATLRPAVDYDVRCPFAVDVESSC